VGINKEPSQMDNFGLRGFVRVNATDTAASGKFHCVKAITDVVVDVTLDDADETEITGIAIPAQGTIEGPFKGVVYGSGGEAWAYNA